MAIGKECATPSDVPSPARYASFQQWRLPHATPVPRYQPNAANKNTEYKQHKRPEDHNEQGREADHLHSASNQQRITRQYVEKDGREPAERGSDPLHELVKLIYISSGYCHASRQHGRGEGGVA
jgi:hypothetical protein